MDPGKCQDNCQAGNNGSNPIQTALGIKFQDETDIPEIGGLGLTRRYSSVPTWKNGTMGTHWRHTYEAKLRVIRPSDTGAYTIWAERPKGELLWFNVSATGQITQDPDNTIVLRALPGSAGWTLTNASDALETYDAQGVLQSIVVSRYNTLRLTYADGRLAMVSNVFGRSLRFDYDASGRLGSVQGPDSLLVRYTYDSQQNLTHATYTTPSAGGGSVSAASRSTTSSTIVAPVPEVRQYHYEKTQFPYANALTGITDESQARYASWDYEAYLPDWAPSEYYLRAIVSTHGPLTSPIDRVEFGFLPDGTSTQLIDALGREVTYTYKTIHGARKVVSTSGLCAGCGGNQASTTYDANGFVDKTVDFSGNATDTDVNARGLVTRQVDAANAAASKRTTDTNWHPALRSPTERKVYDSANTLVAHATWSYNGRGQVTVASRIDPVSGAMASTTTAYCEAADVAATDSSCPILGLVKRVDGPRTDVSDVTSYTYYGKDSLRCATDSAGACPYRKGDLWKVTGAAGHVTETLGYDNAGRPASVKDANGVVTQTVYSLRGWMTSLTVKGATDATTRYEYAPTGLVTKVIQPDGAFTAFTYDGAQRLTGIQDNLGNRVRYTLDNAGNRTRDDTLDPSGALKRTLSRVYNPIGLLQTTKDAQGNATTSTYTADGQLDTVTDPLGRKTDSDYDPLQRLSRTLQDVGGLGAETRYGYDALDRLTKVTDPNALATVYQYDGLGNQTQLSSPDTGVTRYTYDLAGNRKTQLDARGVSAGYGYDALNRLTAITYPSSGLNVGFIYDAVPSACASGETFSKGRLSGFTDGTGSTTLCYDSLGNLVGKTQVTNGQTLTTRSSYSLAGRLLTQTTPAGTLVTYGRDALGRITSVRYRHAGQSADTVLISTVAYSPFGPVAKLTYGNGRTLTRTYDQDYAIDRILGSGPGGLDLDFTIDAVEDITQVVAGTAGNNLKYDNLGRLTDVQALNSALVSKYSYDKTGNRKSKQTPATTQAYTYPSTSHRLSAVAGVSRGYDSAGNTTAIGTRGLVYGDHGRLLTAKEGSTVLKQYAYNGKGERVRKYGGSTPEHLFTYDEAGHLLGQYVPTGASTSARVREYVWMDDLPVAMFDAAAGTAYYIEPDHLGTPRAVIDPSRNVAVWTWPLVNDAFGEGAVNQNPDGDAIAFEQPLRFPGQFLDNETGLHYNYFRDYEPGASRYVQSDPIGLSGGLASYGYSAASPLTAYDRYGLCWSNARAVGHYYAGGGASVSLGQIGCTSIVSGRIQPARDIWIANTKAAARAAAFAMDCGSWKRINASQIATANSGIFWIGGISLLQSSNCIVQKFCSWEDDGKQCVTQNSYSFECLLTSRMHDLFENPSDFDNSGKGSNPDFWDSYSYGGSMFYVDAEWYDSIQGGGQL